METAITAEATAAAVPAEDIRVVAATQAAVAASAVAEMQEAEMQEAAAHTAEEAEDSTLTI